MSFHSRWENAVISKVALAIYVSPANKRSLHTDRPYHGFVINEPFAERDYYFSDGKVMRTRGGDFFYLPKGSTYNVKNACGRADNSCYAINFDAELFDEPFVITPRNPEKILKLFEEASILWKSQAPMSTVAVRKILYEIILIIGKEYEKKYTGKKTDKLLEPAIEQIRTSFTDNKLDVSGLASLAGVSEAYFRRLFLNKYGTSPKEYIIGLRIDYAKTLLASGEVSVSDVALMCGYSEPSHFSREFSKRVGTSPKNYLKVRE